MAFSAFECYLFSSNTLSVIDYAVLVNTDALWINFYCHKGINWEQYYHICFKCCTEIKTTNSIVKIQIKEKIKR